MTIDGYDKHSDDIIPVIHVWKDYMRRDKGCSMHLKHGKKVKVITEYPGYVEIKKGFKKGFVNREFIAELKNG